MNPALQSIIGRIQVTSIVIHHAPWLSPLESLQTCQLCGMTKRTMDQETPAHHFDCPVVVVPEVFEQVEGLRAEVTRLTELAIDRCSQDAEPCWCGHHSPRAHRLVC